MGFGFPKEWRNVVLESEPHKFLPPDPADMRYQWLQVRLSAIDEEEMRDLVLDAWRMVVPKRVAASLRLRAEAGVSDLVQAEVDQVERQEQHDQGEHRRKPPPPHVLQ